MNEKKQSLTLKEKIEKANAIGFFTIAQLDVMEKEPDKYDWSLVKNRKPKQCQTT